MIKNKTIKKKLVSFILSVCMVLTATSIPVVSAISTKTEKAGVGTQRIMKCAWVHIYVYEEDGK